MVKYLSVGIWLCMGLYLSACANFTRAPNVTYLTDSLDHPDIIKFPLKTTAHGRWVITVDVAEGQRADMILDTGATYSAFFSDTVERFGLTVDETNVTRIHGLVSNSYVANAQVERFGFGKDYFYNKNFAILPESKGKADNKIEADGIIGMDIMAGYKIFVDVSEALIYFIHNDFQDLIPPQNMRAIPLMTNPYVDVAPSLHFFALDIKNKRIPALIDTGTDVHIMNWHAATFVEARAVRAQLKSRWKVSGAVGEFKPSIRVHIHEIEASGYEWRDINMIIKDTDSLDIIGVSDNPIVIAGIGFFDNRNIFIDFENDNIWLQNKHFNYNDDRIVTICQKC